MITADNKLQVFEDFLSDSSLPKFLEKKKERAALKQKLRQEHDNESKFDMSADDIDSINDAIVNVRARWEDNSELTFSSSDDMFMNAPGFDATVSPEKPSFWSRVCFWRKNKAPDRKPEQEAKLSVQEFFDSIKHSCKEIDVIKHRMLGYERAIQNAKAAGQVALLEQLKGGLNAHLMESRLASMGLTRYLDEESIVKFYKASEKGLRLDWIKNFTRTVPEDVVATKLRADALHVFDNYVILHYDPQVKSYAETEEEKKKRKDPILFGVMKGKRVLYFVGDWIDEVCDLTLDQLAEALGKEAIKETEGFS